MNTMQFTKENLAKMDNNRLVELIFLNGLAPSQAVAYHLISDLSYRPCDAGRHVEVSSIAITDAFRKARVKMNKN